MIRHDEKTYIRSLIRPVVSDMVGFVCHLGDEFKYCSFGLLYLDSFSSGLLALLYFMVVGRMTGRHFLEYVTKSFLINKLVALYFGY